MDVKKKTEKNPVFFRHNFVIKSSILMREKRTSKMMFYGKIKKFFCRFSRQTG